jgi:nucleotide-binding universal stress UspA family protein
MYPFRRILIPTDFSTAAEWAFDDAVRIAETSGAEIVILHIRMTWEKHPAELRFPADPSLYDYAEQQELNLLRQRTKTKIDTRLVVKQGPDPGLAIARTAAEEKADLIVISTHARHHVAHLLIGSTTLHVVKDPPCPILAIRYGTRKRGTLRRLVVPVHLEQKSRGALDLAKAIVTRDGGEVHLVTVCNDDQRAAAEKLLAEIGRDENTKGMIVRGTDIEKEILRYSSKNDADAIFLNADDKLGERKLDILRHAPTPIMIVPPAITAPR